MSNITIRVALVEDDRAYTAALSEAICCAPDLVLAAAVATRRCALELLDQAACDVLLVDLGLPDGSGIDVIRAASQRWPECGIMVSTVFADDAHVMHSLEAGAMAYLLKDSGENAIVAQIRMLHAGGSPISPLIARRILQRFRQPAAADARPAAACAAPVQSGLSERERQVLELITKGFTSQEIAALLGVSRHTVATFVRRVYNKLEVRSRTEAVYEARQRGLIEA